MSGPQLLRPEWPVPASVHAAFSLRAGGASSGPYAQLNLGTHVGDQPQAVAANRRALRDALQLPSEPLWLQQVHGVRVAQVDTEDADEHGAPLQPADAAVTCERGRVLAIMVADCLPVLFAARDGSVVAAAHAGWRGLAAGVLEATLAATKVSPQQLHVWIGPGIGPGRFEVGPEVRAEFLRQDPVCLRHFRTGEGDRWWCDLPGLARERLQGAGVSSIHGGQWCTASDATRFFSHRRDGVSGRMAALIWL